MDINSAPWGASGSEERFQRRDNNVDSQCNISPVSSISINAAAPAAIAAAGSRLGLHVASMATVIALTVSCALHVAHAMP